MAVLFVETDLKSCYDLKSKTENTCYFKNEILYRNHAKTTLCKSPKQGRLFSQGVYEGFWKDKILSENQADQTNT